MHLSMGSRAGIWLSVATLLKLVSGTRSAPHPSQACILTDASREVREVATQYAMVEALLDPNVTCILLVQTIRFDEQVAAPEGPVFLGRGCVRYNWPFCAHQVLTHTVAVAPAPGLSAFQAEWHWPFRANYDTYFEFADTGHIQLIGVRLFGLFDVDVDRLSSVLEPLAANLEGGAADLESLMTIREMNFDQRNVIGGNMRMTNSTALIECGPSWVVVLDLLGLAFLTEPLGGGAFLTADVNKGLIFINQIQWTVEPGPLKYLINPAEATLDANRFSQMSLRLSIADGAFVCCEADACARGECKQACNLPSKPQDGVVQHQGWDYMLEQHLAKHAAAAAACSRRAGGELASFTSMADYYTVTRTLFSSQGGLVLRDIGLAAWVSPLQSQELDLHWTPASGEEAAANGSACVAVDVTTQLLTRAPCNKSSPSICMRPSLQVARLPPVLPEPPNRSASPSSGKVQVVLPVVIAVAAMACMSYGVFRWIKLRRHADRPACSGRHELSLPSLQVHAELEVESEMGVVMRIKSFQELRSHMPTLMDSYNALVVPENDLQPADSQRSLYAAHIEEGGLPTLCGYEVLNELGRGTNAVCYLAKEAASHRLVALKVPRLEESMPRVVQEAYFLQLIKHPNVVAHKRTVVREGKIVLVTEYCDLGDLHTLLRSSDKPFSERFIRHALLQCAMGLNRMHKCNIAHRDIKPGNVLMTSDGFFKLGDLGASCMILDMEHTSFAGTPSFMAPEVLCGEPQDVQTDIYSLGVMAYMMCTLNPPFVSASVGQLRFKVKHATYEEIPTTLFSEELIALIRSLMLPEPSERPTAGDICKLKWLVQFCKEDYKLFSGARGAFYQEITARSMHMKTAPTADQCEEEPLDVQDESHQLAL